MREHKVCEPHGLVEYSKCRECLREYARRYRQSPKCVARRSSSESLEYEKNYQRNYQKSRYKSDPQFRMAKTIRIMVGAAIRKNKIVGKAIEYLGCTIEELKGHIEKQFQPGMTWENRGRIQKNVRTWNVDHVITLSKFDLTDTKQLLEATNYKNLQPLWAKDNQIKDKPPRR